MNLPCFYCPRTLSFGPALGWRHPGGGVYVMVCQDCGTEHDGPTRRTCPTCGSKNFVDDHCALPRQP